MEAPTAGLYTVPPPAPSVPPPVCPDAANPLFGSCVETLLRGCYEPDRSGRCTSNQGVIRRPVVPAGAVICVEWGRS